MEKKEYDYCGPFGPIFYQFIGKPKEAIVYLLEVKTEEAVGALYHKDIGDIAIVYGNENCGLNKIAAKHPGVLYSLQNILDKMYIIKDKSGENRIRLESETHMAIVSRDYFGKARSPWLLTAFEKKNSVLDNTMDTGETLVGERNDTATPQNTVSKHKDNK